MAEETSAVIVENDAEDTAELRIYEVGYHIIPTVAEENVEKIVGEIRGPIEKAGGSFIAEAAPTLMRLAYPMDAREGDRIVEHDRGHFGWIKFESTIAAAHSLDGVLKTNPNILRFILFRTVREETRARMKAQTLREVKRTDTIHAKPRREKEESVPVSEVDLEKALSEITSE